MGDLIVTITPRTIIKVTVIGAVVVAMVVALPATRGVATDLAVAAAVACLVRPGVLGLARRMRTGLAIFVAYAAVLLGLITFLAFEAGALSAGTKELRRAVPDRLERLQQTLPPGNALRRFLVEDHVVARIRTSIKDIPTRFLFGATSPFRNASELGVFMLIASLSAFMITRGPAIFRRLVAWCPTEWQATADAAGRAAYRTGGAYIRRTLVLAGVSGLAAGGLVLLCHVPGAAMMGLWVGLWAVIPTFGIAVAGLGMVALAFGQGAVEGVGAVVGSVALVVAAEFARRRWIERPTVTVGPLLSIVAVMAGMELGRWMGAFLFLVAAAFFAAGTDGLRISARPRPGTKQPAIRSGDATRGGTSASGPESRRVRVELDTKSLVLAGATAFGLVVAVVFTRSIPHSLTRLIVGLFLALALNPVVGVVEKRVGGRRQVAVAVVVVAALAAVVAFALFTVPRVADQSHHVSAQARAIVSQLDRAPFIGKRIRQSHLDSRIQRGLNDLPHLLTTHDKTLRGAARTAGESLLTGSWMLLAAVAALLDGPALSDKIKALVPTDRRAKVERLGSLMYETVGRSAAGSAFSALLQGAVVMVIALAFRVPLAPVLAANAALWSFIPQVGGLFAGLPLFVFALTRGLPTAIICGCLFLVYMVTNNHLLHPLIVGRAVRISPLTSLIAVLVGVSLGGFVGGLLATPIVGVLRAVTTSRRDAQHHETAASSAAELRDARGPPENGVRLRKTEVARRDGSRQAKERRAR
jgi:putative heme transporter